MADHAACFETPAPPSSFVGAGKVEKLGDLDTYIVGSEAATSAVLLVTDIYGYSVPQFREMADWISSKGFYVVAPDFFHGDPVSETLTPEKRTAWMKQHAPNLSMAAADGVLAALKAKGMGQVAAAGFCWGAKVVVLLKGIRAGVIVHPSRVTVEDIKALRFPLAVLAAEIDPITSADLVVEYETALKENTEVDGRFVVKTFPGVSHGFAVRYKEEKAEKAAREAWEDIVTFFKKNVV